jgi:triosephosphate isomerase
MMQKLIIANWKMNPVGESEALVLAKKIDASNVVIAPPFIFLKTIKKLVKKAWLGAQDVFWENSPAGGSAYTGEVSPDQLKSFGVRYVIIGHSERRALGETDEVINKKVKAALAAGLKVILCVGEPIERGFTRTSRGLTRNEREAKKYVKNQLTKDLRGVKSSVISHRSLVIAYEPIWAIGTGRGDKPEDTAEMAKYIKKLLVISYKFRVKVLYGGSVTSKNVAGFLSQKEIDGALVGGVSSKPKEFQKIISLFKKSELKDE